MSCVYSNSRNDVPPSGSAVRNHCRTHPALCVRPCCVCSVCEHMHSFAGLIRRTPPPTFSDTAITDRHSYTTNFQLRAHWVRISWSVGSEKIVRTCDPGGSRTLDFLHARQAPYPLGQALRQITLTLFK